VPRKCARGLRPPRPSQWSGVGPDALNAYAVLWQLGRPEGERAGREEGREEGEDRAGRPERSGGLAHERLRRGGPGPPTPWAAGA